MQSWQFQFPTNGGSYQSLFDRRTDHGGCMTPDELAQFYEAALTAGAVISGFIGTFLAFRIQREANYHRQPVLDFNPKGSQARARDIDIGLAHFTSSFLLIALAALGSFAFGVAWPLLALAHWPPAITGPGPIAGGLIGSVVLVAAYFVDELVHYRILNCQLANDVKEWKSEWAIVVGGVLLAVVAFILAWHALSNAV
jgi:hypothetical protein